MKANFVPIPNLPDDVVNRVQGNIAAAFNNVDQPTALVIKTVTAGYLVSVDDDVVLCDPSRAAFTVSLPAVGKLTKPVSIRLLNKLLTTNAVDVRAAGQATIDGNSALLVSETPVRLVANAQGYWSV